MEFKVGDKVIVIKSTRKGQGKPNEGRYSGYFIGEFGEISHIDEEEVIQVNFSEARAWYTVDVEEIVIPSKLHLTMYGDS